MPAQTINHQDVETLPRTQVVNTSVRTLQQINLNTDGEFTPNPTTSTDIKGNEVKVGITNIVRDPATNAITAVEYVNPKDSLDQWAVQKFPVKDGVLVLPTSTDAQSSELNTVVKNITGGKTEINLETFDKVLKDTHSWYKTKELVPDIYNSNTSKFAHDNTAQTFGGHEKVSDGVFRKAGGTDEIVIVKGNSNEIIGFQGTSEHVGTQYGKGEIVLLRDSDGTWRKLDMEYAKENLRMPDGKPIDWEKLPVITTQSLLSTSAIKAEPEPAAGIKPEPEKLAKLGKVGLGFGAALGAGEFVGAALDPNMAKTQLDHPLDTSIEMAKSTLKEPFLLASDLFVPAEAKLAKTVGADKLYERLGGEEALKPQSGIINTIKQVYLPDGKVSFWGDLETTKQRMGNLGANFNEIGGRIAKHFTGEQQVPPINTPTDGTPKERKL